MTKSVPNVRSGTRGVRSVYRGLRTRIEERLDSNDSKHSDTMSTSVKKMNDQLRSSPGPSNNDLMTRSCIHTPTSTEEHFLTQSHGMTKKESRLRFVMDHWSGDSAEACGYTTPTRKCSNQEPSFFSYLPNAPEHSLDAKGAVFKHDVPKKVTGIPFRHDSPNEAKGSPFKFTSPLHMSILDDDTDSSKEAKGITFKHDSSKDIRGSPYKYTPPMHTSLLDDIVTIRKKDARPIDTMGAPFTPLSPLHMSILDNFKIDLNNDLIDLDDEPQNTSKTSDADLLREYGLNFDTSKSPRDNWTTFD